MPDLALERCFHHASREAAARCPSCRRFICRECVSEHDDRILCAECLKMELKPEAVKGRSLAGLVRAAELCAGLILLWVSFYMLGQLLFAIPSEIHEGTIWEAASPEGEG